MITKTIYFCQIIDLLYFKTPSKREIQKVWLSDRAAIRRQLHQQDEHGWTFSAT